jgi:NitT/TauT family transport system substrate-binding protein
LKAGEARALCTLNWFIALEKGFFRAEGLDVEPLPQDRSRMHDHALQSAWLNGPEGPVRNDLMPIEYPSLPAMAAGDMDYYIVAGEHSGCRQIVCPTSSSIRTTTDLRGKRIGIHPNEETLIWELLISNAPAVAKPTWIRGPFAAGDPRELEWVKREFADGRIEAYAARDPSGEILKAEGAARLVASNTWTSPLRDWYCCMVGVRKELVDRHPDLPGAVTRAFRLAAAYVAEKPAEVVALAVASGRLAASVAQDVYARLLAEYVWTTTGRIQEDLERYFQLLIDAGRMKGDVPPRELVARVYRSSA